MPLPQIIAYLQQPARETLIEAEMTQTRRKTFDPEYQIRTGQPLPANDTQRPYYVWPAGTNKWGLELRLYFVSDANIPADLDAMCVRNRRPGYEVYDRRLNSNNVIMELFSNGFVLGQQP